MELPTWSPDLFIHLRQSTQSLADMPTGQPSLDSPTLKHSPRSWVVSEIRTEHHRAFSAFLSSVVHVFSFLFSLALTLSPHP